MEKTILVTGKDTYLGNEISQFFLNQGCKASVTVTPRKESFPTVEQDNRLLVFPWYRRSAVSAKNFVLQTVNEFGPLHEAWIVFSPDRESLSFPDLTNLEIEEIVDNQVKGFLFLSRELLAYQAQNPQTKIHFLFFDEDTSELPPIAMFQYAGLRAFVSNLLVQAKKRGALLWAYESALPQADAFASFVLSHPRDTDQKNAGPGRWHVLGEKKNLFTWFQKKD